MNKVKLNTYKINDNSLPKKINRYKFLSLDEKDNIYSIVKKLGGTLINKDKSEFLSLFDLTINENIKLIDSSIINSLTRNIQEDLIMDYLKEKHKIQEIFYHAIKKIRPAKKINNLVVHTTINEIEVKKIGNEFYIIPDISHYVRSYEYLWGNPSKDIIYLKSLIGRKIISKLNSKNKSKYKIDDVITDREEVNKIINYALNNLGYENIKQIEDKFGLIDYNQPVLMSRQKSITLYFLPQLCNLIYEPKDLQNNYDISKYWSLKNTEKEKIITEVIKSTDNLIINHQPELFSYNKYDNPKLIVRDENNNLIEVRSINNLFSWLNNDKSPVYLPHYLPDIIKNSDIPIFILLDKKLNEEKKSQIRKKFIDLINKYRLIKKKSNNNLPNLKMSHKSFDFTNNNFNHTLNEIKKEFTNSNYKLGLSIIFSENKDTNSDFYESIKRQLFQMNIVSQNITWEKWNLDKDGYMTNNLLIQIMSKLGVKYFALKSKFDYDIILGLDVGIGEYKNHRVGGCTVIFDSNGYIKRIQPIETASPGETLNLKKIFEYLKNKTDIDLFDKKILLIRDGKIQNKEIQDLTTISSEITSDITILNIKKDNKHNIYDDNLSGISILLDDTAILLTHRTPKDKASNPLKIDSKYNLVQGKCSKSQINLSDLDLLYKLTKLNYSTLYGEMRLPAPIHYADKFVKALGKDWRINNDLLKEGLLYFI